MGMFDWIDVPCPKCKKTSQFQTKSGPCLLEGYTLENVPADVLLDVNRHAPAICECGVLFEVGTIDNKPTPVEVKPVERKKCRVCFGEGKIAAPIGNGFMIDCKYCR